MYRKEAIEFLRQYIDNDCYTKKCQEANRMAVIALTLPTQKQMERVWPGCEYCTKQVETRKEVGWDDSGDAICIESNDTLAVIGSDSWEFLANYCPMCGSPITPAAWAELKKRLEEADDGK